MTGEKLKQVRSIRRWLEKAEKSYTSDQDISGELNLIMAQAEMQRLKEKDTSGRRKRVWGLRVIAFSAAVGIFSGVSFMWDMLGEEPRALPQPAPSVAVSVSPSKKAGETPAPAALSVPEANSSIAEQAAEKSMPVSTAQPAPAPADEVRVSSEPARQERMPAPSPVLSQKEIQSVVGEAGRALRGQS